MARPNPNSIRPPRPRANRALVNLRDEDAKNRASWEVLDWLHLPGEPQAGGSAPGPKTRVGAEHFLDRRTLRYCAEDRCPGTGRGGPGGRGGGPGGPSGGPGGSTGGRCLGVLSGRLGVSFGILSHLLVASKRVWARPRSGPDESVVVNITAKVGVERIADCSEKWRSASGLRGLDENRRSELQGVPLLHK